MYAFGPWYWKGWNLELRFPIIASDRYLFLSIDPQDQDQDSLLVKHRNDNHSPGPVIRELVPSSHQRSELSNTILCIFSRWDQRIGEGIPIPDSLGEEAIFINICIAMWVWNAIECWFLQRLVLGIRIRGFAGNRGTRAFISGEQGNKCLKMRGTGEQKQF